MARPRTILPPRVGTFLRSTRSISPTTVQGWRYGDACGSVGEGLLPGARMKVLEIRSSPAQSWVRLQMPGRKESEALCATLQEMAGLFRR